MKINVHQLGVSRSKKIRLQIYRYLHIDGRICFELSIFLDSPTKQLVKQQEPQSKPQVEQKKAPQSQVKINHDDQVDDLKMIKKRTRRGGKAREGIQLIFKMP